MPGEAAGAGQAVTWMRGVAATVEAEGATAGEAKWAAMKELEQPIPGAGRRAGGVRVARGGAGRRR